MGEDFMNRIICGDALEEMRKMPDGCFDLVITSPPYNVRTTTSGGFNPVGTWAGCSLAKGYDGYSDDMPEDEYEAWQNECLKEMYRLVKDEGGAVFYNHRWRSQNSQWQMRPRIFEGIPVRQIVIWHKGPGINANNTCFMPSYEVIYILAKKGFRLVKGKNAYTDVWDIPPERSKSWHPAPFPEEIPRRAIESTGAGSVLDPFAGSGTTCVAAKRMGVAYCGIEQSAAYCEKIEERLAGAVSNSLDRYRRGRP